MATYHQLSHRENKVREKNSLQRILSKRNDNQLDRQPPRDGGNLQRATSLQEKSRQILSEINLPIELLPLDELTEVGQNKTTGFVWLKQKKKAEHKFHKIGRTVSYDTEMTAFVEDRKMKRLTGVKTKEFMLWISLSDIYIADPSSDKITFGTSTGMSRSFPTRLLS